MTHKLSRREFLKVASVAAGAAALAACAPKTTTPKEGAGGAPSTESVTIEFWTFNDYAVGKALEIFKGFITKFEDTNKNIKVNLTGKPGSDILAGLVAGAGAGNLPDSVQIQLGVGGDLISASALADMSPYWDTMPDDYKKQFNPGAMTPCIQDGKVYGLPFSAYAAILFRNLKVLQKAGIDPKAGVKDWEDFASQLDKVSKAGAKGLGKILGSDWCQMHYYGGVKGTSKKTIAADGKSTELKADAYTTLFDYTLRIKPYCIGSFQYDTATSDLFMTDQLGFLSMGPWLAPTLEEAKAKSGLDWDAVEIPGQTEDWKGTIRGGEFTGIMPTKNKEAAWKWASFISDYPQEATWASSIGRLMANDKALQQPDVQKNWLVQLTGKAFNNAVDESLFMKKVATGWSQPEIDYGNQVDTGAMKPAEAAQKLVEEVNKILAAG